MNRDANIIITGSGISGLSCYIYLKRKGYTNVLILEKNNRPGGKIDHININGIYYPLGAIVVHSPESSLLKGYLDSTGVSLSKTINISTRRNGTTLVGMANLSKEILNLRRTWSKINKEDYKNVNAEKFCTDINTNNAYKFITSELQHYGYNSIYTSSIYKFMEFVDYIIDSPYNETSPDLFTLVDSIISNENVNIRYNTTVASISNDIIILEDLSTITYDKVIITGIPENINNPRVSRFIDNLEYSNISSFLAVVPNPSKLPLWYRDEDIAFRTYDGTISNNIMGFMYTPYTLSPEFCVDKLKCKYKEFNNVTYIDNTHRVWTHDIRFKNQFQSDIDYQGEDNMYFTNSAFGVDLVASNFQSAHDLIDRYF